MTQAEQWIKTLGLKRHPEGGYFLETYRSSDRILGTALPVRFAESRDASTAIYFVLDNESSRFHRINSDEMWHFYAGSTIVVHVLGPDGYQANMLGTDLASGERPQVLVPAGHWMAAEPAPQGGSALMGCTVSPGFEFQDLEFSKADDLIAVYPDHAGLINRLC